MVVTAADAGRGCPGIPSAFPPHPCELCMALSAFCTRGRAASVGTRPGRLRNIKHARLVLWLLRRQTTRACYVKRRDIVKLASSARKPASSTLSLAASAFLFCDRFFPTACDCCPAISHGAAQTNHQGN